MFIFYADEAGCTGALPSTTSPIQPVFLLAGILIHQTEIRSLTLDFINLKERFFPGRCPPESEYLDWMNIEVKGSELRRDIREGSRNEQRHVIGFLDHFFDFLEEHNARIIGRIYVKEVGKPFVGRAVYTAAVQNLSIDFQQYLKEVDDTGLLILDSRHKQVNCNVSHSIFTQKFRTAGDAYDRFLEMPLFGHSDNHAGIQCADLICSALLFPMTTYAYCLGHVRNVHVDVRYSIIRERYGERLRHLQFRYQDAEGKYRGGITVSDAIGHQSGAVLFGHHKSGQKTIR